MKTKKDKDSDTAEAIIQAARRLFSAYGHGKTTVREIAGEAKVSKATVYNYFAGKDEIVTGVLEYEKTILAGKLRKAVGEAANPMDALGRYFRTRAREVKRLNSYYRAKREDFLLFMPQIAATIEHSRREEQEILKEILQQGIREGVFRPFPDVSLVADLLFTSLVGVTFPLFGGGGRRSVSGRLEQLIDLLIMGIRNKE